MQSGIYCYAVLSFLMWLECWMHAKPLKRERDAVPSSATLHRVPGLGLEGEPGLRRAQPHPAGEQEAGQGPGEPVAQ